MVVGAAGIHPLNTPRPGVRYCCMRRLFTASKSFLRPSPLQLVHNVRGYRSDIRAQLGPVATWTPEKPIKMGKKDKSKNRMNRRGPSAAYLQVMGVGTDIGDSVGSVLLFFDNHRYVFNAGEGLQRFCLEHKVRLSKIGTFLLTRTSADATGGIPGAMLTMAGMDLGSSGDTARGFRVVGPAPVHELVVGMRHFANPRDFDLQVTELRPLTKEEGDSRCVWGPAVDENALVTIRSILLRPDPVAAPGNPDTGAVGYCREEDAPGDRPSKRPRTDEAQLGSGSGPQEGVCMIGVEGRLGTVTCYVAELAPYPGKFLPEKAQALGVQPGRDFGRLKQGESVTVADGTVVLPQQCMEPDVPGPIVVVADCPSPEYLTALTEGKPWDELLGQVGGKPGEEKEGGEGPVNGVAKSDRLACVVHLGPEEVVTHHAYQGWMSRFPERCKHVVVNAGACHNEPVLRSSALLMARLARLDPSVFQNHFNADFAPRHASGAELPNGALSGFNMLKLHMFPPDRMGQVEEPPVPEPLEISEDIAEIAEEGAPGGWNEERPSGLDDESLEITFLGTGASCPSKYRNVSAILMRRTTPGGRCMLMDCGEGTFGQLVRRFGREMADDVVRSLSCVWISHIHADHHIGLRRILGKRIELLGAPYCSANPLLVIAPRPVRNVIVTYAGIEHTACRFLDCTMTETTYSNLPPIPKDLATRAAPTLGVKLETGTTGALAGGSGQAAEGDGGRPEEEKTSERGALEGAASRDGAGGVSGMAQVVTRKSAVSPALDGVLRDLGLVGLESVRVHHCSNAFACVVHGEAGWKIVYSGDTRPCSAMVEASKRATLLIHEATFEDELVGEAIGRRHSTVSEAVSIGAMAGAYRTILTHFSQRYPRIPPIASGCQHSTCVAFDLMTVRMRDLPTLPATVPKLMRLFETAVPGEGEGDGE